MLLDQTTTAEIDLSSLPDESPHIVSIKRIQYLDTDNGQ